MNNLSIPTITEEGDLYIVRWDEGVIVTICEWYGHRNKKIDAEIEVIDESELNPHLFGPVRQEITGTFTTAIREIERVSERADWQQRFTQIKKMVLPKFRAGAPVISLGNMENPRPTTEVLQGVVWQGLPSLVYGPGGIGKSALALVFASALHTGTSVGGRQAIQSNTLYLDWETSEDLTYWRNKMILDASGITSGDWVDPDAHESRRTAFVFYRFMAGPIWDAVEFLRQEVARLNIRTVIVDSAGPACGGEPESSAATLAFFEALRRLGPHDQPLNTLILAHVSHEGRKKMTGGSSPFGSVYWINIPRNVFELQNDQPKGSTVASFALHHRKSNTGPLYEAGGFKMNWLPDGITLDYYDIRQSAQLMLSMPTADRAHHLITQAGATSTGELASELGLKDDDVSVELTKDERFESVPGIDQNGHKGPVWAITEELGV